MAADVERRVGQSAPRTESSGAAPSPRRDRASFYAAYPLALVPAKVSCPYRQRSLSLGGRNRS